MDKRRRSSISCFRKSIGTTDCQLAIYVNIEKCLRSSFENAFLEVFGNSDVDAEKLNDFKQECIKLSPGLARDICRSTPIPLIEHSANPTQSALVATKKHLKDYSQVLHKEEKEWSSMAERLKAESKEAHEEYDRKNEVPHLDINGMGSRYKKLFLKKPDYKNIVMQCHSDLKEINSNITKTIITSRKNIGTRAACHKELKVIARNMHNELMFNGRDIVKLLD